MRKYTNIDESLTPTIYKEVAYRHTPDPSVSGPRSRYAGRKEKVVIKYPAIILDSGYTLVKFGTSDYEYALINDYSDDHVLEGDGNFIEEIYKAYQKIKNQKVDLPNDYYDLEFN